MMRNKTGGKTRKDKKESREEKKGAKMRRMNWSK